MKTLAITGISGFIASHIAIQALEKGYHVIGTIRSTAKADRVRSILAKHVGDKKTSNVDFREASLDAADGWVDALRGADAVLHVASPFPSGIPKDENELIRPARHGVKVVFEAALELGIERIVQTSSVAAIMYGYDGKPGHGPDGAFNESDWTVIEGPGVGAYVKSKTMAERDVWSLVDKHPSLKVTTVCPSFVQGPQLSDSLGTSGEIIVKVMRGELPGFPRLGMTFVDVRDVAALHLLALEYETTIGERLIASAYTLWLREMGEAILEEFPELKGKIKPRELPNFFVKLFALFDRETKLIVPELGNYPVASNAKARELVGWEPRSGREAVRAAARSLVELGVVSV
tara:strand:+ start:318 stop:1358 length:1041 start_codon:yes stop_codon:yes gene_type:complete